MSRNDSMLSATTEPASWNHSAASETELPGILTLDLARQWALNANPDIQSSQARLEAAAARISEARSVYFPTVSLVHNSSRQFLVPASSNRFVNPFIPQTPTLDPTQALTTDVILETLLQQIPFGQTANSISGSSDSFSQHASSFAVTWTLFDGFVREARLKGACFSEAGATWALADVRRLLTRAVEAAFYQAQLGREELRVALADEEFSRQQWTDVKKRLEVGKARQDEALSFEVRVTAAQSDVLAATGAYQIGRILLAEMMGLSEAKLPDSVEIAALDANGDGELVMPDEQEWVDRAMILRPDLKAMAEQVRASQQSIRMAQGQFWPVLNLSGSYGFDKISNVGYSDDDQASALALEMNYPLFTGGLRTSQLRRAVAEKNEKESDLQRQRLMVASDVRQAVIALKNAQDQVRLQESNLNVAEERRRIVAKEYSLGKVALETLESAQRDYTVTDANLARARIQVRQAWSQLRASSAENLSPS